MATPEVTALAEAMLEQCTELALGHPRAAVAEAITRVCRAMLVGCAPVGREDHLLQLSARIIALPKEERLHS